MVRSNQDRASRLLDRVSRLAERPLPRDGPMQSGLVRSINSSNSIKFDTTGASSLRSKSSNFLSRVCRSSCNDPILIVPASPHSTEPEPDSQSLVLGSLLHGADASAFKNHHFAASFNMLETHVPCSLLLKCRLSTLMEVASEGSRGCLRKSTLRPTGITRRCHNSQTVGIATSWHARSQSNARVFLPCGARRRRCVRHRPVMWRYGGCAAYASAKSA